MHNNKGVLALKISTAINETLTEREYTFIARQCYAFYYMLFTIYIHATKKITEKFFFSMEKKVVRAFGVHPN